MARKVLALVAGVLVVATLTGFGQPQRRQQLSHEQPAAARAVAALARDDATAASAIPADFASVMGYRPAVVRADGRMVPTRPAGGCSSPFGATPYDFGTACGQHDLGYDLLRYADRKGQPLGPWARRAVDDRVARQARERCDDVACEAAGAGYAAVLELNSMRQGYGVPVAEPIWRWLVAALAGLLAALLLSRRRIPVHGPRALR